MGEGGAAENQWKRKEDKGARNNKVNEGMEMDNVAVDVNSRNVLSGWVYIFLLGGFYFDRKICDEATEGVVH